MAAFALQPIAQTRYYIRLDSSAAATETDQTLYSARLNCIPIPRPR